VVSDYGGDARGMKTKDKGQRTKDRGQRTEEGDDLISRDLLSGLFPLAFILQRPDTGLESS
jgi:hypothetical protein